FGFDVLEQRGRLHGLEPVGIPLERRFDLDQYLKMRYGPNYAPDQRLWHAIHKNGVAKPALLSAEAAAAAWSRGDTASLADALSAKVAAIRDLLARVRQGSFLTGGIEAPDARRPKWDADRRELWYGAVLCKRYRRPAPNQEKILAAFEEDGWPGRIDDPLDPG